MADCRGEMTMNRPSASAGQQLTSAANWTVMIARFIGPVLLALAVLAIRTRVKR